MLKEYIKEKKISIYKLSEISNVPYSTLNELINGKKNIDECKIKTIQSISNVFNISIESLLNILNGDKIVLSTSWEDNKYKVFYFPTVVENLNYDYKRIHPLKQKIINELYNTIKDIEVIEKVILFGSSINIRCNKNSDIDIAVKLKDEQFTIKYKNDISEIIQEITNYNSDIVWLNSIDKSSQLYVNINKMGVKIYE